MSATTSKISLQDEITELGVSVSPEIWDPTKWAMHVSIPDWLPPAIDTEAYSISDLDETGTTKYYWFTDKVWNRYILSLTDIQARYIKGTSNYTTNWTNRASLVYDYYYNIF